VTQVVHSLLLGGSERLACSLARSFDPLRIHASMCALDLDGPLRAELEHASIPVAVMARRPGFDGRLCLELLRLFRRWRPDVVQTHHLTQLIYAALGARLAGAALIHVEHEFFTLSNQTAQRRLRLLARFCSRVVSVGDQIREFLVGQVGLPASKVVVIRNGVDTARYQPVATVSRIALGLPPDGPLIGHVARLEPDKDQETLLRAFSDVRQAHETAHLVIVGAGSLEPSLQALARTLRIEASVRFLGARHDIPQLLPHFDVFALSSTREGLPLAMLEAMACARPVVATGVGDVPTVLGDGRCGVAVPPSDAGRLAQAVSQLLGQPARRTALGQTARERVCRDYSLTRTVEQYERLYRSALPGSDRI
jgi:L-malate glycosyltransferase